MIRRKAHRREGIHEGTGITEERRDGWGNNGRKQAKREGRRLESRKKGGGEEGTGEKEKTYPSCRS
jgi:hypothetical protein